MKFGHLKKVLGHTATAGTLLIKKSDDEWRLFNTVVDQWEEPVMNTQQMVKFLIQRGDHDNEKEIKERMSRKGYNDEHIQRMHLNDYPYYDKLNKRRVAEDKRYNEKQSKK